MNNESFKKVTEDLMAHCREQLGYDTDPDVHYVTDDVNAESMLAKTAHYQPSNRTVTVYVSKRHPKDILRSLAHELVHHSQNCRGDLDNIQTPEGYAQNDPHMRSMEEEAYLKGNMLFRDWSDGYTAQQTESKLNLIGENKMTEFKNIIKKKVLEVLKEAHGPGHPLGRGKARAPGTMTLDKVTNWVLEPSGRFHAEFELGGELQTMTGQLDADAMDLIGDMQSQQSYEKEVGLSPEEMQQGNPFRESIEEINMPLEVIEEIKNLDDNIERLMAQRDSLALEHGERPRYEGLVSETDDRIHEEEEEEEVEEAKKPDEDGDGVPDWADKKPGKDDHEDKKDNVEETYGNPDRGGQASKRRYNPDQDASRDTYSSADRAKMAQKKKNDSKYKAAMRAQGLLEDEEVNELKNVKQTQDSIKKLNEQRLLNIHKALMDKLLKN